MAARLSRAASSAATGGDADAFRRFGHEVATIDPLREWSVRGDSGSGLPAAGSDAARGAYTGNVGFEFEHCESAAERAWWAAQAESRLESGPVMTTAQKRNAHLLMTQAEVWEHFLGKKFVTLKRYSGEGAEAMLPLLDEIIGAASKGGVGEVVIGMPHRGRLATLVSLLGYPARQLFRKLRGGADIAAGIPGMDDVSSHVAASCVRTYGSTTARVSMLHNPSHLEAVNPVAMGKTRAKRDGAGSASKWATPAAATAQSGPGAGSADAMCLLVHGDGAFSGQGVVWESLAMATLPGFNVGGTVHVVVNNQVAFTATRREGRSSSYCTDVAKGIGAPVLHVNGEDLDAVVWAGRTAVAYRKKFNRDVLIDLVTYRRHGHNEVDQPRFTQPHMYSGITEKQGFPSTYAAALRTEGVLSDSRDATLRGQLDKFLQAELDASADLTDESGSWGVGPAPFGGDSTPDDIPASGLVTKDGSAFGGKWAGIRLPNALEIPGSRSGVATGMSFDDLVRVGKHTVAVPEGVTVHDHLMRGHFIARTEALDQAASDPSEPVINWATAEGMAFASLLDQGFDVRMSGQDVERGTFSHRHGVVVCQESGRKVPILNECVPGAAGRGKLHSVSSHLSEFGVLGFEYGYSLESPGVLPVWEAQFGDFANCAQVIIDQFLSGSETKWMRQSGLVMLLPHGFDGAGPEHSSARIERFLQLVNSPAWATGGVDVDVSLEGMDDAVSAALRAAGVRTLPPSHAAAASRASPSAAVAGAEDKSWFEGINFSVCQPSTPANYFHLLRRQVLRPFRKPLVVVAPKTLLRLRGARSALAEMGPESEFRPLIGASPTGSAEEVKTVLFCSGRQYYELEAAINEAGASATTAIARVEEIAPFPTDDLEAELKRFPNAERVAWVQEEPANAGAWSFVRAHAAAVTKTAAPKSTGLELVSRPVCPTPAVGVGSMHKVQEALLKKDILATLPTE
ncbi:hypothetical protein FNF27_00908 [Cafeteria roenbergensis]|uniref:Transketolase-like pyrimidine-binding domain-containing protein n=1 Tax=Cafeteria roenbergensis TaxID=33653 RepID=A0A5A8EIL6_CAFRO|nr:hypothetical protein FNF27_00908 [Cafeteria roenbergensis]